MDEGTCSIWHSPVTLVLNITPSHQVFMEAKAANFGVGYYPDIPKMTWIRVSRSLLNTKNTGTSGVFEPPMDSPWELLLRHMGNS